jgi:hypothetical protein
MCWAEGRPANYRWTLQTPIRRSVSGKDPMRHERFQAEVASEDWSQCLEICVAMIPVACRSTCTYRVLLLVLNPPGHEVPHESLKTNNLVGRGESIPEGDIQCHIAGGNGGVRNTKD